MQDITSGYHIAYIASACIATDMAVTACMQHAAAQRIITDVLLSVEVVVPGSCSAGDLTSSGLSSRVQLCINRLVWGGLKVSILIQEQKPATTVTALEDLKASLHPHVQTLPFAEWQPSTLLPEHLPASTAGEDNSVHQPCAVLVISPRDQHWASQLPLDSCLVWTVNSELDTADHTRSCSQDQPGSSSMCWSSETTLKVLPSIQHLPQQLALYQQQVMPSIKVVAYVMSAKREKELSTLTPVTEQGEPGYTGGMLCLLPQHNLVFMPLDLTQPLEQQGPFQVLLHKASDQLQQAPGQPPTYSLAIQQLQAWLQARPHIKVVDPLDHTAKVIDRVVLAQVVDSIADQASMVLGEEGFHSTTVMVCSPRYCIVHAKDVDRIVADVRAAGLQPPYIVKPSVACGLPAAHTMCLVLADSQLAAAVQAAGFDEPLVVQEFRNHGGQVAKVYVAGQQVFHTLRPSISDLPPNVVHQWSMCHQSAGRAQSAQEDAIHGSRNAGLADGCGHLLEHGFVVFDSLKCLPTSWSSNSGQSPPHCMLQDMSLQFLLPGLLKEAAGKLQQALGLSLFGFDVVAVRATPHKIQLQVIDVNYLPNYRVVGAATHIWKAIWDTTSPA